MIQNYMVKSGINKYLGKDNPVSKTGKFDTMY